MATLALQMYCSTQVQHWSLNLSHRSILCKKVHLMLSKAFPKSTLILTQSLLDFEHQLTSSVAVMNESVSSRFLWKSDCDKVMMDGKMSASLLVRTLEMIFWIPLIKLIGRMLLALHALSFLGMRKT